VAFVVFCAGSLWLLPVSVSAADLPLHARVTVARRPVQPKYYWRAIEIQGGEIQGGAQIVTLFCHLDSPAPGGVTEVPLVAVLRDTLGDDNIGSDRLRYVWLLSYVHPSWPRQALSAIPFFYWRVGGGGKQVKYKVPKPLIDISQPAGPIVSNVARDILQWSLFDPMMMPVRASSRTYRTNQLDNERLHLEEAIGYLRQAPVTDGEAADSLGDPSALTQAELNTVVARLSLRNNLLGGLVSAQRAEKMGENAGFEREAIRSRNMETLRECAEKAGLILEPISLAGHNSQYAVLWYPVNVQFARSDSPLYTVWKVLSISDPAKDQRLRNWQGPRFERTLDSNGSLLPEGTPGAPVQLIPLAVYGMNYPTRPLLLADFRDARRVRLREMTQRVVDDTASGVLGLSHFTNWYFFAGEGFFEFVQSHRGGAVNRLARLDCYSQFRVELSLDHDLDPALRTEMEKHLGSMALNPLEVSPSREIAVAEGHYKALIADAGAVTRSKLANRLENDRRVELAEFGRSDKQRLSDALLHQATFGIYSRRATKSGLTTIALGRDRRIDYNLAFLDKLVQAGTDPEVTYPVQRIRESVNTLAELTPGVSARNVRERAAVAIDTLSRLSSDPSLQADCARAAADIKAGPRLLDLDAGLFSTRADIESANGADVARASDSTK
jgi:hypothetical protein